METLLQRVALLCGPEAGLPRMTLVAESRKTAQGLRKHAETTLPRQLAKALSSFHGARPNESNLSFLEALLGRNKAVLWSLFGLQDRDPAAGVLALQTGAEDCPR